MGFVLDSDDDLNSAMGTETLAAHDLVPEEREDTLVNSFAVKACLFD
jgi:hypothetical protein